MLTCTNCGGKYDDNFKFCPHCGEAKSASSNTQNSNPIIEEDWELCEIDVTMKTIRSFPIKRSVMFEAIAIGSQGRYSVALSEPLFDGSGQTFTFTWNLKAADFSYDEDDYDDKERLTFHEGAQKKFTAFVNQLIKEGWQPTGKGRKWYSERFRRKAKVKR